MKKYFWSVPQWAFPSVFFFVCVCVSFSELLAFIFLVQQKLSMCYLLTELEAGKWENWNGIKDTSTVNLSSLCLTVQLPTPFFSYWLFFFLILYYITFFFYIMEIKYLKGDLISFLFFFKIKVCPIFPENMCEIV